MKELFDSYQRLLEIDEERIAEQIVDLVMQDQVGADQGSELAARQEGGARMPKIGKSKKGKSKTGAAVYDVFLQIGNLPFNGTYDPKTNMIKLAIHTTSV